MNRRRRANSPHTCSVDGCDDGVETRGFCNRHYTRLRFHGSTDIVKRIATYGSQPCSVSDCGLRARSRGYCAKHHRRWMKHGDPLVVGRSGRPTVTAERRRETAREGQRRRKVRMAGAAGQHTPDEWLALLEEHDGLCAYCGALAVERDHIIPISRGGTDDISNIVPSCRSCNATKRTLTPAEWLAA